MKRDRIQSGLSLGVCPVQTPTKSGTQHTIEFSRKQNRFLFTPTPLQQDENENAIQGNIELMNAGVTVLQNKESYKSIHNNLLDYKLKLDNEHYERFEKMNSIQRSAESIEKLNLFDG